MHQCEGVYALFLGVCEYISGKLHSFEMAIAGGLRLIHTHTIWWRFGKPFRQGRWPQLVSCGNEPSLLHLTSERSLQMLKITRSLDLPPYQFRPNPILNHRPCPTKGEGRLQSKAVRCAGIRCPCPEAKDLKSKAHFLILPNDLLIPWFEVT